MKNSFLFKRGKYYHLQYFDETEGKSKRISTKCTKKSDAIFFLTEFTEKVSNKLSPISLYSFLDEYENFVRENLSSKYLNNVKTTCKELKGFTDNILLKKLTPKILEDFISTTFKRSKYSAKHNFNNLRSAFNKAKRWGYLQANPMLDVDPPKIPENNPLFITESDLSLILSKETNQTLKDIYLFAFHTGARLGEIVNVKWNQVSLTERIIKIKNTKDFITKGKKERSIPINVNLFNMLQNRIPKVILLDREELVFTKNGFKFNGDYISRKFKKAVRASKINPNIHFHDLRHSFASNLVKKGVSIYIVMQLLGHRDVRTTQKYSHLTMETLREAVKTLEG